MASKDMLSFCHICRNRTPCVLHSTPGRNAAMNILPHSPTRPSKVKCQYSMRGCKYTLEVPDFKQHHAECRFRDFSCEGDGFCWDCSWNGRYDQIQQHFLEEHKDSTLMLFKTEAKLQLDLSEDYSNISLIDYRDGQNFFWYKCRLDKSKRKFYSAVQMIGTRQQAEKYFYEFEIFKGPIRKIKVTETCESDATDIASIFQNENCVAVSFKTLENYLDEDKSMMFRFRIMSCRKNPVE